MTVAQLLERLQNYAASDPDTEVEFSVEGTGKGRIANTSLLHDIEDGPRVVITVRPPKDTLQGVAASLERAVNRCPGCGARVER